MSAELPQPTARRLEALRHMADGCTVRGTARAMGVTANTVKTLLRLARAALGADSTTHAVAVAFRRGLLR